MGNRCEMEANEISGSFKNHVAVAAGTGFGAIAASGGIDNWPDAIVAGLGVWLVVKGVMGYVEDRQFMEGQNRPTFIKGDPPQKVPYDGPDDPYWDK